MLADVLADHLQFKTLSRQVHVAFSLGGIIEAEMLWGLFDVWDSPDGVA